MIAEGLAPMSARRWKKRRPQDGGWLPRVSLPRRLCSPAGRVSVYFGEVFSLSGKTRKGEIFYFLYVQIFSEIRDFQGKTSLLQ